MHERALRYFDDQRGQAVRKREPLRREPERRADAVRADLADVRLEGIHLLPVHGTYLTGVRYAEDERPTQRVAERGQLIRDPFPVGPANPATVEYGLLELDAAVLAERELRQQPVRVPDHDRRSPCLPLRSPSIVRDHGRSE